MSPCTSIRLIGGESETVLSVRINMHLKGNIAVAKMFSKDKRVLYVNGSIVRGVPKEYLGRVFGNKRS